MATRKKAAEVAVAVETKSVVPNLFSRAVQTAKETAPAKKTGTTIPLPKDVDDSGKIKKEYQPLHEAITAVIDQTKTKKAAESLVGAAKGTLNSFVESAFAQLYASLGASPETPIKVTNYLGDSLTYIVQDKTAQNPLSPEQVEMITTLVGPEYAKEMIVDVVEFMFNTDTMREPAGFVATGLSAEETAALPKVQDIVGEIVSKAISEDARLTDEQKSTLLSAKHKTLLRRSTLSRLAEITGGSAARIEELYEAFGSAVVRYLSA
jgi:hypothetical protein